MQDASRALKVQCICVAGQNEIKMKIKSLCLLTVIMYRSWTIRVRKNKVIENQTGFKSL